MNKSIMWSYILQEQERCMQLLYDKDIIKKAEQFQSIKAIYFTAHGSSYNAAISVSDFISRYANVRCYCYTPGNILYQQHSLWLEPKESTLVIGISQTGTSTGVLEALKTISKHGYQTLAVTDTKAAEITTIAEHVLYMHCGEEASNAKTKGYSCTLLLLLLFAIHLGKSKGCLQTDILHHELYSSIQEINNTVQQTTKWCEKNTIGQNMKDLYVIGYHMHFGTALEGQLKVMETMCIPTMFNDLFELSHGMHRSIHMDSTILLIKAGSELQELMEDTYQYLKTISTHVYILDTMLQDDDPHRLSLPYFEYTRSLLNITTALQVISVYAPEYNGLDPNRTANDEYTVVAATRKM